MPDQPETVLRQAQQALADVAADLRQADQALERAAPSQTPKLRCPSCGEPLSRVINTRAVGAADPVIRRRRVCEGCGTRFSTVERVVVLSAKKSA